MKTVLSKIYAEILNLYYNKTINYSHINQNGYWEFAIGESTYFGDFDVIYKTKGYKS